MVGFNVYEKSNSPACYDFKSERCYIGHFVQLRGRSLPIDSSLFSDEIRRQLPADKVIAIRYIYGNSHEYMAHQSKKNAFITDFSIYPSSPEWKLPKHTFMNMPESYRATNFEETFDNKEIRYVPMVRNNDTAYYFIKPVNGEPVKSELSSYHQRYEKMVETTIAETTDSNK
ncbi:hypothetical protein ACRZ5S_22570 (plasmid) [Vibrio scophthalmi]|uniref:hypothetical protein n=1 Tax=Vibrio scophthalmi TaxID=45658 RepID=UPI003EBFBF96